MFSDHVLSMNGAELQWLLAARLYMTGVPALPMLPSLLAKYFSVILGPVLALIV